MSRSILHNEPITGAILETFFSYNPEIGIFLHKTYRGPRSGGPGSVAGTRMSHGYITIGLPNGQQALGHHLAWLWMTGDWPKSEIDHKNRIRSDNRWENLREATRSQNGMNGSIRTTNNTGKIGISFDHRRGKYVARLMVGYETVFQKRYDTFDEAAAARDAAERQYFGEFAPCP